LLFFMVRVGWVPPQSSTFNLSHRKGSLHIGLPADLEAFVRGDVRGHDPRVIEWSRHDDAQ